MMYPENEEQVYAQRQRAGMLNVGLGPIGDTAGFQQAKQPGAIQEAISRANGIANLLENTNGLLDNSLSRISGGVPVPDTGRNGMNSPQASGDIGLLMAVLDCIYALTELNSNYASQVARL